MTKKEYLYTPTCPHCGAFLTAGDSGEPNLTDGWWCNDCEPAEFFTQDDLDYYAEQEPIDDIFDGLPGSDDDDSPA